MAAQVTKTVLKLLFTPTTGATIKGKRPVHDLKEYSVHFDVRFYRKVAHRLQKKENKSTSQNYSTSLLNND